LNAIEMAFAKLKALLRKAQREPVKPSGTKSAMRYPPSHRRKGANYFKHAGYAPF